MKRAIPLQRRATPRKLKTIFRSEKWIVWIKSLVCVVPGCYRTPCDPAHVRGSKQGGTALKPGDQWTIPLCRSHHREQHQIGEPAFGRRYRFDMVKVCRQLQQWSPYRAQLEKFDEDTQRR